MPKMWEMCKILFFGGNAMIDTIYSIYLTQWEQLSKSLFFVWPTRVFIDGTASILGGFVWNTIFHFSVKQKGLAVGTSPAWKGELIWSLIFPLPAFIWTPPPQHSSKPVSLHHQLHLHHRHRHQQHHRLKGCDALDGWPQYYKGGLSRCINEARILIYNLHVLHGCILSWNCWNMQSGSIPPGDHLQPCTDQLKRWVVVQIQIHKCINTQIQITKYKSFCTDESDQQKMGRSWTVKWLLPKFNVSLCSFMSWTILLAQRCGVLCNGQRVLLCAAKMHWSVASCMYNCTS